MKNELKMYRYITDGQDQSVKASDIKWDGGGG